MALSGKQSPLGVNTLSGLLLNEGITVNPVAVETLGQSRTNDQYSPGTLINNTLLKNLTYAINNAFRRGQPSSTGVITQSSINGTELTVGTLTSGYIQPGMILTGTGITPGTTIVSKVSGEGTGSVWTVNLSQTVSNITINLSTTGYTVNNTVYTNLLNIGQSRIPALGNSKPPTYINNDPSGSWSGEATTGYAIPGPTGQGQNAKWQTWNATAPNVSVTQWGFLRLLALQAWNEFNYNGNPLFLNIMDYYPPLKNYASTFVSYNAFVQQSNQVITTMRQSTNFAEGTYSNMNDMITADITGVSLSTQAFGQDLINLGRAINLSKITTFGLPSNLLSVMQANAAVSPAVTLGLFSSGLTQDEIDSILLTGLATPEQERKLYNCFTAIDGADLTEVLQVMRVTTKGIARLSDLLSVKKLFPISRGTLTVPIYNTNPGPTNSKTYYLLFVNDDINPQLLSPKLQTEIPVIESYPAIDDTVTVNYPILPTEVVINEEKQAIVEAPKPLLPQVQNIPYNNRLGPGGGGGGCVVLDAYLPSVETRKHNDRLVEKAWQFEPSFDILLADENLQSRVGKVVKATIDYQQCVRIVTASGIRLSCSTTAPILTKDKGYVDAPKLFGERVAVLRNNIAFWDEVVSIEDLGYKFVRPIDTGNNSFWAGDMQNAYILHHNIYINDTELGVTFAKK